MLFLDGVYVERPDGSLHFCWVKAPASAELARLTRDLAQRIGRYLERQGLLERDAENSYLAGDDLEAGPMEQLLGSSMMCRDARMSRAQDAQERPTYRIAVGPQQGRKVFTLQTLPACGETFDAGVGKVAGFSLHAGVAARADQRQKLERPCRYDVQGCTSVAGGRKPGATITRPAIAKKRLSLTSNGNVRYQLKTPYRDGTTHVIFEPLDPEERTAAERRAVMTWAQRLKRVFGIDIETPDQVRGRPRIRSGAGPGSGPGQALPGLRWGDADHRVY